VTALKIPHDFELYLKWFFKTYHGPEKSIRRWWQLRAKHYKVMALKDGEPRERLWVYTRWGAFFIDWSWA
jgi:hypothetical protein